MCHIFCKFSSLFIEANKNYYLKDGDNTHQGVKKIFF